MATPTDDNEADGNLGKYIVRLIWRRYTRVLPLVLNIRKVSWRDKHFIAHLSFWICLHSTYYFIDNLAFIRLSA